MDRSVAAYTSASGEFPYKILKNKELLLSMLDEKKIVPIHLQFNPTNKCNLNCSFCSCSERDKKVELKFDRIVELIKKFHTLGCKSVTITGGGEPLMHDQINDIIHQFYMSGIKIGLVTNGFKLPEVTQLNNITWLRISVSDETRIFKLFDCLDRSMKPDDNIDWSFSYVVSKTPDIAKIKQTLAYATEHNFTHVRIVNNILKPLCDLSRLRRQVLDVGANDKLAIWQDRQNYSVGTERCLISLLKPVVDANGDLYPCCGAQYALEVPSRDYASPMKMGQLEEIDEIWSLQKHFDGSNCIKCYYKHYNDSLASLLDTINHVEFV